MRRKSSKIFIDIRARLKVQPDSLEARLERYLKDDKATPFMRHKLITEALSTYYLPLVLSYEGATKEEVRQSLVDVDEAWQRHFDYLQKRLGIDLSSEVPSSSWAVNQKTQGQYLQSPPEAELEPEVVIKPQVDLDEERGGYPPVF